MSDCKMSEEENLAILARNIEAQINELNDLEHRVIERSKMLDNELSQAKLLDAINKNRLKLTNLLKLR